MGYEGELSTAALPTATPTRVRFFSVSVAAVAVGAGVALVAAGVPLPSLGPVLVLAVVAALCVNRFVLFPNEHAATAEAAVLLAAIVGFRNEAVYVGPLAVALLVGLLDAAHWEQRAFVRMAYNAGNRGLATLPAAFVFVGSREVIGHTTFAWIAAIALAAATFTVVDVGLSVVLLRLQGARVTGALEHLVDIDVLTFPIACVGGAAGILAGQVGWWATLLALLPIAFLPELVIARARVRARAVRDLAALLSLVALLAIVALVAPDEGTVTLALLAAVALVVGAELTLERGVLVPPMIATVVAAAVAVGGEHARLAAALVALVATATVWWCGPERFGKRGVAALVVTGGIGVLASEVAGALEGPRASVGTAALVAALVFGLAAVLTSPGRRHRGIALTWSVPLVAAAVAWAALWSEIGFVGAAVWVVAMGAAVGMAAWWGAPPWRARWALPTPARGRGAALVAVAVVALGGAVVGTVVHNRSAAPAWAWLGSGAAEVLVAMTACGVRQWRFAPRARIRGLVVVTGAAVVLVAAVPSLVADGSWAGPALVLAVVAAVLGESRVPRRRRAEVDDTRARAGSR